MRTSGRPVFDSRHGIGTGPDTSPRMARRCAQFVHRRHMLLPQFHTTRCAFQKPIFVFCSNSTCTRPFTAELTHGHLRLHGFGVHCMNQVENSPPPSTLFLKGASVSLKIWHRGVGRVKYSLNLRVQLRIRIRPETSVEIFKSLVAPPGIRPPAKPFPEPSCGADSELQYTSKDTKHIEVFVVGNVSGDSEFMQAHLQHHGFSIWTGERCGSSQLSP